MVVKKKQKNKASYAAPIVCTIMIMLAVSAVVIAAVVSINQANNNGSSSEVEKDALTSISSREFLDFLAEKRTGFVYLGRPTCPHCQVFAPILEKVAKADNLLAYYYDTDEAKADPELKSEVLDAVEVKSVPTFMFIRDGVVVDRLKDTESEDALREFIEKYLESID